MQTRLPMEIVDRDMAQVLAAKTKAERLQNWLGDVAVGGQDDDNNTSCGESDLDRPGDPTRSSQENVAWRLTNCSATHHVN